MNPMEQLRLLMNAVDEQVKDLPLKRITLNATPAEDGRPDTIFMIFEIDRKIISPSDQTEIDSVFDSLVSEIMEDTKIDKLNETKENLKRWLDEE